MPWSAPSVQPTAPESYVAVFFSTLPDSAGGGGPFSIKVTVDWPVIGATEVEWNTLFQSVVSTLVASGNFTFSHAEKVGVTQWNLTP